MVEVLISLPPSGKDMRGVFYLLSLGEVVRPVSASVTTRLRNVTFLNVVDVFIILRFWEGVKPCILRFCLEPC
jgi:hypothetical protein